MKYLKGVINNFSKKKERVNLIKLKIEGAIVNFANIIKGLNELVYEIENKEKGLYKGLSNSLKKLKFQCKKINKFLQNNVNTKSTTSKDIVKKFYEKKIELYKAIKKNNMKIFDIVQSIQCLKYDMQQQDQLTNGIGKIDYEVDHYEVFQDIVETEEEKTDKRKIEQEKKIKELENKIEEEKKLLEDKKKIIMQEITDLEKMVKAPINVKELREKMKEKYMKLIDKINKILNPES
ncbi:hypothetical protein ACFL2K_02930, partial [Candidatus Margulisiibacteriota bacterium]